MCHIERITRLRNSAHDGRIVDFLFFIQVVATGVPRRVKVSDILDIVLECADNITLHNLHVVDIVEQFRSRRVDALTHLYAPRGAITLIVGMVDLAIEQFQAEVDPFLFGGLCDAAESLCNNIDPFLIG